MESEEDETSEFEAVRHLLLPLNIRRRSVLEQTAPRGSSGPSSAMAKKRQSKAKPGVDRSGNALKSSPMRVSKSARKKATFDPATLFKENSKLVGVDLVVCYQHLSKILKLTITLQKYFKSPKATATLDEKDRVELRKLLPEHLELTDEGMPTLDFLRYNNDWRNGLRNFSTDLEAGRLDKEWLKTAHGAMERRALGQFDDFKQQQFEQFWGQKGDVSIEKSPTELVIKTNDDLELLVEMGKIVEGDYWYFRQTFGRGLRAVIVEKHCRVC